jgi:N-acetylglucosamine-6-phosphate deacetylase
MKPLHHRDVGPIGWGLTRDDVTVDVIADLHHLSADMLRLIWKAKGEGRVVLVSDAVPAAGLADGPHTIWGETLTLRDGCVRNASGNLAGSAVLLDTCVERLASCGIPLEAALGAAGTVPRRLLGL